MSNVIVQGPGAPAGVTPKFFRMARPLAAQLGAESAATGRAEVRIVEQALSQFLSLPVEDRDRSLRVAVEGAR